MIILKSYQYDPKKRLFEMQAVVVSTVEGNVEHDYQYDVENIASTVCRTIFQSDQLFQATYHGNFFIYYDYSENEFTDDHTDLPILLSGDKLQSSDFALGSDWFNFRIGKEWTPGIDVDRICTPGWHAMKMRLHFHENLNYFSRYAQSFSMKLDRPDDA